MEDNVFNEWAAATLDGLINSTAKLPSRERLIYHSTNDDTFGLLTNRTIELSAFTARTFPPRVQFYPVLYPFGGLDLLNARAAFPHAPAYVIMSNLPLGSRACFASPNCAATARKSAVGFLRHAHEYGLAWTSTERMSQLFGMQAVGTTAPIGVLPSLLLCARLMGLRIRSVRSLKTSDGGEHLAFRQHAVYASNLTGVVVETNGPRLVYLSVTIKLDRDDILGWGWRPMPKIDAAATAVALADIEHAVRQVIGDVPPILMLKAAPHYINRDPIVAKWALRLAGATLHTTRLALYPRITMTRCSRAACSGPCTALVGSSTGRSGSAFGTDARPTRSSSCARGRSCLSAGGTLLALRRNGLLAMACSSPDGEGRFCDRGRERES
jgi:hypothetical protein